MSFCISGARSKVSLDESSKPWIYLGSISNACFQHFYHRRTIKEVLKLPSTHSSSVSAKKQHLRAISAKKQHLRGAKFRLFEKHVPLKVLRSYQKSSKRLLNQAQNLGKIHTTKIHRQKWISGDSHFLVWTRVYIVFWSSSLFPLNFL